MLAELVKIEAAWTMASAHSGASHSAHVMPSHPEHTRSTKERLEYLVWIDIGCKKTKTHYKVITPFEK